MQKPKIGQEWSKSGFIVQFQWKFEKSILIEFFSPGTLTYKELKCFGTDLVMKPPKCFLTLFKIFVIEFMDVTPIFQFFDPLPPLVTPVLP